MPPPTDQALLFDPHLDLSPPAFVATWNRYAYAVATARLATLHFPTPANPSAATNIVILASEQPLEPHQLHDLIHIVATLCGVDQPLHFQQTTRPDGGLLTLVIVQNLTIT